MNAHKSGCECAKGTYLSLDQTECVDTCSGAQVTSNGGACVCKSGYYIGLDTASCTTCQNVGEVLVDSSCTCDTGYEANSAQSACVCASGTYLSLDGTECVDTCSGTGVTADDATQ